METIKKDKKAYPSELNSKAVACRLPLEKYAELLNESIDKGLTINDLLIWKLFGNNKINGTTNSGFSLTKEDVINSKGEWIMEEDRWTLWCRIIEAQNNSKETLIRFLDSLLIQLEISKTRVADIEDVKNQLTILINEKFRNVRDRQEYRAEILPLLKELE